MTKKQIEEQVRSIVADQLGTDADKIQRDAAFQEDLGADVLDFYELIMKFEEAFGISVPSDDEQKLNTLGGATDYIASVLQVN